MKRGREEAIPAFTSESVAKKLRFKSEDRYINQKMEEELKAYRKEIERRFKKSKVNNY